MKKAPLNWKQLDQLARGLAVDLLEEHSACNILMVLMQEIAEYPFDPSHVETVANLINTHLFGSSREADVAFREHVAGQRRLLINGGAR
jgi:hypothetical protein